MHDLVIYEEAVQDEMLFGKYPVTGSKHPDRIYMRVGNPEIARAKLLKIPDLDLFEFTAGLSSSDVATFRELYTDAQRHFFAKGVSPTKASYLASLGDIVWLQDTNSAIVTAQFQEFMHACAEYLDGAYGLQEEEVVPFGYFGSMTRGSKVWTLEKGLWIVAEPSGVENSFAQLHIQINSDETQKPSQLEEIGADLARQVPRLIPIQGEVNYQRMSHDFRISLHELERPRLGARQDQYGVREHRPGELPKPI